MGAKGAMAVGRGMIDFADDVTFDIQGKRAERHAEFEEGNAKGRALNNAMAIMDTDAEEQQAIWASHIAANAIQGPEEYDIATPDVTDKEDDTPGASSSGSGNTKKKKETAAQKAERERKEMEARRRNNNRIDKKNAREEQMLKRGFR